jgi:uncharacterized protein (TIGR00661 family)
MGNFTWTGKKPKILVAPLDWGLGHATRCIPIIYELINLSCEVIIATAGDQERLLRGEFPQLRFTRLDGYGVRYAPGKLANRLTISRQVPKIIRSIRKENKWLHRFIVTEQPDAVISDNRYGLCADQIPCILITHQIHIRTGFGNAIDQILEKMNHHYIRRFSACWIPDNPDQSSLAGALSNPPSVKGVPTVMIGPISRFRPWQIKSGDHILVLLSGPEPQRTILEIKLLGLAKLIARPIIFVRGLPLETQLPESPPNVRVFNHAATDQLNHWICAAEFVISRSGYTTIMDLMLLGKKSILIPTPGQSEQEYLAEQLYQKKLAYLICQDQLSAEKIEAVRSFSFLPYNASGRCNMRTAIDELLQKTSQKKK